MSSDWGAILCVPAGEAMPDLLGMSAGCGLVGCRKPGSLMTLRYTHNPARGWDFLADPVLVGVTACEVKGDTGQGQLRIRGGLPPWPDPLRGPSLGLRMFGCWNHALVLSGDATRTWRSRALVPSGDATPLCSFVFGEVSSSRRPSGAAASRPCAEYYISFLYIR